MHSLLRWSIENSAPSSAGDAPPPLRDIDPELITHILGKPDAQLMQEAFEIARDPAKDEAARVTALDDFEMLVENIDNANDLSKLNMWESLHGLLSAATTTDPLKVQTLWVIGTALQNNPAAQLAYLGLNPLPVILSSLSPSSNSAKTRAKAMYALSGLLKHNVEAIRQLNAANGWHTLRNALEDSDITVRRKVAFLLNTLLLPTSAVEVPSTARAPVHPNSHASIVADPASASTGALTVGALQRESDTDGSSLMDAVVSSLVDPVPFGPDGERETDGEFQESLVRLLHTFAVQCNGKLSDAQKLGLREFFREARGEFGLDVKELDELQDCMGTITSELGD